ncbi:MAG: BlaI/MecI/CopY family transcriptional regulator [Thermodesulfobacteriota bacterium]
MVAGFAKSFKLGRKGLGSTLGELEQAIMDHLWGCGEATGKEVFEGLRREREIALTTVLTVLERLVKKGLIKKRKGESANLFTPACTREEFTRGVSEEVLKGVLDLSASSATASFVDLLGETDPEELDRLSTLIEMKKKELERKG